MLVSNAQINKPYTISFASRGGEYKGIAGIVLEKKVKLLVLHWIFSGFYPDQNTIKVVSNDYNGL